MAEYLRALIVILILSLTFFALVRQPVAALLPAPDFSRWRNIWILLTIAAFLAHGYAIFVLLAAILLTIARRRENNIPALYLFLLFALPMSVYVIPGFGLVNYIFDLTHGRLLALLLLLPAWWRQRKQAGSPRMGSMPPDRILLAYLILTALLYFRDFNLTNNLRQIFYLFLDVYLPYVVISRGIRTAEEFREVALGLVLGIMVLAPIAVFEFAKSWLLYSPLPELLGQEGYALYLPRDGLLRALATSGQPIVLGFLMTVGLGFYLYIQQHIDGKWHRPLGWLALLGGLVAPLSRGPWVGAVVLLLVFILTGKDGIKNMVKLGVAGMFALAIISMLPGGEKVINLLPFVGNTEKENVEYREQLLQNSMLVIERNPLFGTVDYLSTPEMEAMRQGQGIIDMVNSYIAIALEKGLAGLGLFVACFALLMLRIGGRLRHLPEQCHEERLQGRVLLATLVAILLIIFTMSSIFAIPLTYWSVLAMGAAFLRFSSQTGAAERR